MSSQPQDSTAVRYVPDFMKAAKSGPLDLTALMVRRAKGGELVWDAVVEFDLSEGVGAGEWPPNLAAFRTGVVRALAENGGPAFKLRLEPAHETKLKVEAQVNGESGVAFDGGAALRYIQISAAEGVGSIRWVFRLFKAEAAYIVDLLASDVWLTTLPKQADLFEVKPLAEVTDLPPEAGDGEEE